MKYANLSTPVLYTLMLSLLLGGSACNDGSGIGTSFFGDDLTQITVIDTLSLEVSTIIEDSLSTLNQGRLLVGYQADPELGIVKTSGFFQLGLDNFITPDEETTSFDSITLFLNMDGYYFYDTAVVYTMYVHQLTEEIELTEDDNLFNNTSFSYDPTPLGQISFIPRPNREEEIEIRLKDELGIDILNRIYENDESISSTDDFQRFLKGLVILPDTTTNNPILGFSVTTGIRLYYSDREEIPEVQEVIDFPINGFHFNQIQSNRSDTPIASLVDLDNPVLSTESGNKSYIQGGVGMRMRVRIPHLKQLQLDNEDFIVTTAELTFRPVIERQKDQDNLPSILSVLWVDEDNSVLAENTGASLIRDDDFGRDSYYTLNATSYVRFLLSKDEINEDALLISFTNPNFDSSVHRLVIGDDQLQDYKMELQLYVVDLQ